MGKQFFYVCAGIFLLAMTFIAVTGRSVRIRVDHKDVTTRSVVP